MNSLTRKLNLNLDYETRILLIQINKKGTTIKFSIDKDTYYHSLFLERCCDFKYIPLAYKQEDVLKYYPNLVLDYDNPDVVNNYEKLLKDTWEWKKDILLTDNNKLLDYNPEYNIFTFSSPVIQSSISISCIKELEDVKLNSNGKENLIYRNIQVLEIMSNGFNH